MLSWAELALSGASAHVGLSLALPSLSQRVLPSLGGEALQRLLSESQGVLNVIIGPPLRPLLGFLQVS